MAHAAKCAAASAGAHRLADLRQSHQGVAGKEEWAQVETLTQQIDQEVSVIQKFIKELELRHRRRRSDSFTARYARGHADRPLRGAPDRRGPDGAIIARRGMMLTGELIMTLRDISDLPGMDQTVWVRP